jgi:hypothetical protein
MSYRAALVIPFACWLAACGPTAPADDDDDDTDARDAAIDGLPGIDAIDAPEADPSRVYAHSGKMLYRIDTLTMAAVPVGAFTTLEANENMLDLALDRDDTMIGVARNRIFTINPATAACTFIADYPGSGLTSLSFVPVNIGAPDGPEMLIAATDTGDVVRIDITGTTGTATVIGNYGTSGGTQIVSSGDLVYIKGVGTFATVDVGPASGDDFLASVDPVNSWRASVIGLGTGHNNIFGVAFWGGALYGFADDGFTAATGKFLALDRVTGAGTVIQPGAIRWFGAGVTTEAPLIP